MTDSWWILLVAAGLIAIAGVLAAVETAVGRVSRSRVEEIAKETPGRAARLRTIVADRARYVNVLLFVQLACSTMAIILVGQYVLATMPEHPWWAVLLATAIMVVVGYIVLGVAPRTLGRQYAESIAMWAAGPTRLLAAVLNPLTRLLILVGNALTPGKGFPEGPFTTAAELRELVDQAEADMLIEDDERRMIHSVFELADTYAREVMVPRTEMVWMQSTSTLRQALNLGLRSGYSRIPAVGKDVDDIVGVVYLKDVTRALFQSRENENSVAVSTLMRAAYFVPDSKPVDELMRDMQSERVHLAIVVDEYGGTAGLVTIEDVLEEIVGEIADEYDTAAPEVQRLDDGAYRVSARMHVDDFAELIGIEIDSDEEGIETVGGLMGKRLGFVPIPGTEVVIDGWTLLAESSEGRRNRLGLVVARPAGFAAPSAP
jgi:hypothetical protein